LDLYSDSSLKEQSLVGHVALLVHIILIPRRQIFALTPEYCMINREAANTIL